MKILICDDDKNFIKQITHDIQHFFSLNIDIQIDAKTHDFLKLDYESYDIVFMDIKLKEIDGIQLAYMIKQKKPQSIIIFVSSMNDLVFDTLSVGIFQFIRKSHYQKDFDKVMRELREYLDNNNRYVLFQSGNRQVKVLVKDIQYVISIGRKTTINCSNQDIICTSTFKEMMEKINSPDIIQIQRAVAINVRYVLDMKNWEVQFKNGTFPIGRKYRDDFLKNYMDYLIRY